MRGFSIDEERRQKAGRKKFERIEQSIPTLLPHILEHGSDKVAMDLLNLLADGPKKPAELRAALDISSANFFTSRYLTPLARLGYIAIVGGGRNWFSPAKQYELLPKGRRIQEAAYKSRLMSQSIPVKG